MKLFNPKAQKLFFGKDGKVEKQLNKRVYKNTTQPFSKDLNKQDKLYLSYQQYQNMSRAIKTNLENKTDFFKGLAKIKDPSARRKSYLNLEMPYRAPSKAHAAKQHLNDYYEEELSMSGYLKMAKNKSSIERMKSMVMENQSMEFMKMENLLKHKKTRAWETILLTKRFQNKMMAVKRAKDQTRLVHILRQFSVSNDVKKAFFKIRLIMDKAKFMRKWKRVREELDPYLEMLKYEISIEEPKVRRKHKRRVKIDSNFQNFEILFFRF